MVALGRGWREAAQDEVGDALGERVVDRAAGDQQAVEERAAEHVEGELDVEAGAQVAAGDAAVEHRAQRRAAGVEEAVADRARQLGPAVHGSDEAGHDAGAQRVAVDLHRLAHEHEQVLARGPRIGDPDLADQRGHGRRDELVLGGVAAVDGGLADAGALGDVVDAQVADADLRDQLERGGADRVVDARVTRAAGRSGFALWN